MRLDGGIRVPSRIETKGGRDLGGGPTWSMGDSGADLHQLQYLRLDQIGQINPRCDHLIEVRIL